MEFAELAMRYCADLTALQLNVGAKLLGRETPDAVRPQPDDERQRGDEAIEEIHAKLWGMRALQSRSIALAFASFKEPQLQ